MSRCPGYVRVLEGYITCACMLEEHAVTVPHICECGGSWFGHEGEIDEVVSYPRIDVSTGKEI